MIESIDIESICWNLTPQISLLTKNLPKIARAFGPRDSTGHATDYRRVHGEKQDGISLRLDVFRDVSSHLYDGENILTHQDRH